MNNKLLAINLVGKIKNILKETELENKKVKKDTSLENPILSDIILSNEANAYKKILAAYKEYKIKKEESSNEE